ncbi:MAG: hypothetical protein KC415_19245 [Anaerolineales bacterium]|nr:hypothetical protein [Anaerolineales bacterium]
MSVEETPLDEQLEQIEEELEEVRSGVHAWVTQNIWYRVPKKYRQNVEPEILAVNLLTDEEQQLEIHMAWYRDLISNIVFGHFSWLFVTNLVLTAVVFLSTRNPIYTLIPSALLLLSIVEAAREFIEYNQWRLIKTNKRLIISLPQHGSWPLVDNVEMGDLPKVIDTNWSGNPVWRLFQFFTGARDVYISLTAFKFEEGTARVKDAIVIPDVMPDDVYRFKNLVFGKK